MQLSRLNWWDDFIKVCHDSLPALVGWGVTYCSIICTLPSHQYNLECCKNFWTKIYNVFDIVRLPIYGKTWTQCVKPRYKSCGKQAWHKCLKKDVSIMTIASVISYQENWELVIIVDRKAREIMYLVASVHLSICLSICLFVRPLRDEPFDLRPWFFGIYSITWWLLWCSVHPPVCLWGLSCLNRIWIIELMRSIGF